ncbi:hypothetical protein [Devosia ginsengisoli]|uniref:Uncharacterized protein n=1 Tax=Devosia ginsengisoli TaxID=400770 RepID=A0A5B8LSY2_9HYPH|nr:hypothetical protein [Devosia ginsengisoli]QDZ11303.1 hypothetical protein FPZ08_11365 [Devosia ginsengisoli]
MQVPSTLVGEEAVLLEIVEALRGAGIKGPLDVKQDSSLSSLSFDLGVVATMVSIIEVGIFSVTMSATIFNALKKNQGTHIEIRLANGKRVTFSSSEALTSEQIKDELVLLLGQ